MYELDPVIVATIRLLGAVVNHGNEEDARRASYYQQRIMMMSSNFIVDEGVEITPFLTLGRGEAATMVLLGYDLFHKHNQVTPSLEADFFVPMYESKQYLKIVKNLIERHGALWGFK